MGRKNLIQIGTISRVNHTYLLLMGKNKENPVKIGEIGWAIFPTVLTNPVFTQENTYQYSHIQPNKYSAHKQQHDRSPS